MEKPDAVSLRDVWKFYGVGKSKVPVLNGINITVSRGSIYGLLGPSGCGKTTALRCIVGRLHVDHGVVEVFGHPPGSTLSGIPGYNVGYMPQELALFRELTIKETLRYFGRLHSMKANKVQERIEFLLDFLNLPSDFRLIKNLSGGQQRRVSFASALLQEPPLLILDEPTVGVDPLLRESVWKHLLDISCSGNTTVIITTHYIEEAQKAHKVGFMRNGHILVEGQPSCLMEQFGLSSLENVFLELCRINGSECLQPAEAICDSRECERSYSTSEEASLLNDEENKTEFLQPPKFSQQFSRSSSRIRGLVLKNFIRMWRTFGFLVFQFLIPSIQIILFCLAIGGDPKNLNIAVVNEDLILGPKYLQSLDNETIKQTQAVTMDLAIQDVKNLHAWGTLYIGSNFTEDLNKRILHPGQVPQSVIDGGSVHVRLDMTDQQIGYTLQKTFMTGFQTFVTRELGPKLSRSLSSPVQFGNPIYGVAEPHYTDFLAPGVLLSITYFMAVGLTALSFVLERKEGLLDRSYVAGVTSVEVMISHIITQFGVMIIQITLVLVFLMVVFGIKSQGPVVWIIFLAILQGTCGMTYGFLISTVCDHENSAIMLSLGSFYPNMLLSGIIWPIQAMPPFLQYLSIVLPQTYATEALRCVFSRGFDITYRPVWEGFLITMAWIVGFLLFSAFVIKVRQ